MILSPLTLIFITVLCQKFII